MGRRPAQVRVWSAGATAAIALFAGAYLLDGTLRADRPQPRSRPPPGPVDLLSWPIAEVAPWLALGTVEAAVVQVGPDRLAEVLCHAPTFRSNWAWAGLERGLRRHGVSEGLRALRDLEPRWPEGQRARLAEVAEHLAWWEARGRGATEDPAPEIAAQVGSVLAGKSRSGTGDPDVERLLGLGPRAIRPLLEFLDGERGDPVAGLAYVAAAETVGLLAGNAYLDEMTRRVDGGSRASVAALEHMVWNAQDAERAATALAGAIDRGPLDWGLEDAARVFSRDLRVQRALRGWLARPESYGRSPDLVRGESDEVRVARILVDVGDAQATDLVAGHLDRAKDPGDRLELAEILLEAGDRRGIEALLRDLVRTNPQWPETARVLWEVANGATPIVPTEARDNLDQVRRQYEEWWARSKDRIRYDRERKTWRTD